MERREETERWNVVDKVASTGKIVRHSHGIRGTRGSGKVEIPPTLHLLSVAITNYSKTSSHRGPRIALAGCVALMLVSLERSAVFLDGIRSLKLLIYGREIPLKNDPLDERRGCVIEPSLRLSGSSVSFQNCEDQK